MSFVSCVCHISFIVNENFARYLKRTRTFEYLYLISMKLSLIWFSEYLIVVTLRFVRQNEKKLWPNVAFIFYAQTETVCTYLFVLIIHLRLRSLYKMHFFPLVDGIRLCISLFSCYSHWLCIYKRNVLTSNLVITSSFNEPISFYKVISHIIND